MRAFFATIPIALLICFAVMSWPQMARAGDGYATYYCCSFHGRITASGERYNQNALTAAHMHYPFGTVLRVTNKSTGASVVVRVNDRGAFAAPNVDLSRGAFSAIARLGAGRVPVKIERVK